MPNAIKVDVLVIGSGAAGLGLALSLANKFKIAILCKDNLQTSSSKHAQGGIAAVMGQGDSLDSHIQDTIIAGAGLCDPAIVHYTVSNAKKAIELLIAQGVQFTTSTEESSQPYHLTQEGGHSHRRILHAADQTGAEVVKTLSQQVIDHPNIICLNNHTAIDLIVNANQCSGAYVLDNQQQQIKSIFAKTCVLATGGASMAYLHTSNPGHTSGDGIAIGFNAGARVANMEFNQFHPTCFYNPNGKTFLISEVMRGEGAKLILPSGQRFMDNYDQRAELAPRDIVARAIDNEIKTKNLSHIYLNISQEPSEKIKKLFPTIFKLCLEQGIDITQSPIPVVPAAHYTCGGVITNARGQTDVAGLYAIGEVACTGLHGANRMASNSLLECLVFANSAAQTIEQQLTEKNISTPTTQFFHSGTSSIDNKILQELTTKLRTTMWDYVGIVRSNERLQLALNNLKEIEEHFIPIWKNSKITLPLVELRNILETAKLITYSAISRKESRGAHYNIDYPQKLNDAKNTIAIPTADHGGIRIEYSHDIHTLITGTS